jgi:hypothetical protein
MLGYLDVCPSACSNNGECGPYDTCICKVGYDGLGCEELESNDTYHPALMSDKQLLTFRLPR